MKACQIWSEVASLLSARAYTHPTDCSTWTTEVVGRPNDDIGSDINKRNADTVWMYNERQDSQCKLVHGVQHSWKHAARRLQRHTDMCYALERYPNAGNSRVVECQSQRVRKHDFGNFCSPEQQPDRTRYIFLLVGLFYRLAFVFISE